MIGFLLGMAIGLVGVIAMWCGALWQTDDDEATANDGRMLLAMGAGILLAGCAFSAIGGAIYPDVQFKAKHIIVAARDVPHHVTRASAAR
jgi:hypothetical protein